jgi:hypothetical protein
MSRKNRRLNSRQLRFEALESRRVLAAFTVTNLNDAVVVAPGNAPGTLRQAIYDANHSPGADTIAFAANLSGSVNLSFADDAALGSSALVVSSPITIAGNANGITVARNAGAGEMRLFRVTAAGNLTLQAISLTGGIARGQDASLPDQDGGLGLGGAIYSEGVLQIASSTLYGNQAIGGNGGQQSGLSGTGRGGAIYSDNATLVITNATLSGNSSQSGGGFLVVNSFGGATYSVNGSTSIRNSTVTNNAAPAGRGVYVYVDNVTTVDIQSSILGQSDTAIPKRDLIIAPAIENPPLTVTGSSNLIRSQNDYNFITISTDDPMLGPLANNGGATATHAITAESPVVNMGNNSQNLDEDQRGGVFSRVVGGAADIGAYELQSIVVPPLPTDYSGNTVVDAADYVVWRKTLGTTVPSFTGGDGTGDGAVDTTDFNAWRSTFGATAPGVAAFAVSHIDPSPSMEAVPSSRVSRVLRAEASIATRSQAPPVPSWTLIALASIGNRAEIAIDDASTTRRTLGDAESAAVCDVDANSADAIFAVWPSA